MPISSAIERLLDVVGADFTSEAQHLQDQLANSTRLLAPLSLHGFTFVTLGHMYWEVVSLWICLHKQRL